MTGRNRAGLTLVEVFVIIVVLGVLMALLVAYLTIPHGPSRRTECLYKQKQLALALWNYESAHGHFPGYVNRVGQTSGGKWVVGSWVVSILPYLERDDLSGLWTTGRAQDDADRDGNPDGFVGMPLLRCPSDPIQGSPPYTGISYVVNCGLPGDEDTVADGVFHNHDVDKPVLVSIKDIADGAAMTLLLSENVQAGRWTDTAEADVGMVWRHAPEPCGGINECLDAGDRPSDLRYARPSSHHPGVVVATFCDGHVQSLDEGIDYRVYQHLMTPDSAAAGVPGKLDEGDFQP
jgi:hypothetical protein